MPSERSRAILEDMVNLSVEVIEYCQTLSLPASVVNQITKSASSIGANFSEAQDASSRKDFINKIYIAKKESAETKYWLAVIAKISGPSRSCDNLSQKVQNYTMMFQKIINTSKGPIVNC